MFYFAAKYSLGVPFRVGFDATPPPPPPKKKKKKKKKKQNNKKKHLLDPKVPVGGGTQLMTGASLHRTFQFHPSHSKVEFIVMYINPLLAQ